MTNFLLEGKQWPGAVRGALDTRAGPADVAAPPTDGRQPDAGGYIAESGDYAVRLDAIKNESLGGAWQAVYLIFHKAHNVPAGYGSTLAYALALMEAAQSELDKALGRDATKPYAGRN